MKTLHGKRILITGGARGIGLALGRRFAAHGATPLLTDVDDEALAAAARAVDRARTYRLDVTDPASIDVARDRIHRDGGPVDVVINNAGIVFGGALLDVPLERHERTYRINLLGPVAVTHAFLPDLLSRPEAHLVNVASASGLIGLPFGSTYASSKWGVIGFSESLRLELELQGHRHVKVTTACPSYVSTGLFEGAKPPRATRMLTPERLADLVVRAVLGNRIWILAPWLVRLTPPLKGLLPARVFDRVASMLGATESMKAWRGR